MTTHCTFNERDGYGCGVCKRLDDSEFSIVGGDAGVGFDSWYVVPEKATINVLSNISGGDNGIRKVVLGFLSGR